MYSVKVQGSKGWRVAVEKSLQACLALVDGLRCNYRIVRDDMLLLLEQLELRIVAQSKLLGKPLRDYRYLQGKRVAKQFPVIDAKHVQLILDLATFPRVAELAAVADDWQPVREALQTRSRRAS
jgi:hypothetical protein